MLAVPDWAKSDQYDLEAKVEAVDARKLETLTFDQRKSMLQPLLMDRFNLKYHHETRELQVYELVISNGGYKLKRSKAEEALSEFGPPQLDDRRRREYRSSVIFDR